MTRNIRVNIYRTKVYSDYESRFLWARTVSFDLCESVITHQGVKSCFYTHSLAHAGFHLMYANLTSKWGFSLIEAPLRVWRRKRGMDSSHTILDTSLGCSYQCLHLLMRNRYAQKAILVLVCSTTTWKHILGKGTSLLEDASANYLSWDGINLFSQISTLFL